MYVYYIIGNEFPQIKFAKHQNSVVSLDDILHELATDVRRGAVALLGTQLVRGKKRARIVEVEAYRGLDDPGSHAFRGPTPRNEVMFGPPGRAYVYFTYGMHWMLNVTTQHHGIGAAVLIRAAEPLNGVDEMRRNRPKAYKKEDLLSGPAKICAAFEIDRAQNGTNLFHKTGLRIEKGDQPVQILHGTRIGLAAGKGDNHLWRFVDGAALRWVSTPKNNLQPLLLAPDRINPAH